MDNILLIDDDRSFHDLFGVYVRRLGCNLLQAFDGVEGERMALLHKPVLIVIDIMMPKQNGYTTCQNLRAQGYRGAVSITSALHEISNPVKFHECVANGYLVKPPDAAVLALHLEYARSDMKYPTVAEWIQNRS